MTRALVPLAFLLSASFLSGQQFVISTIAGGAPPPTPAGAPDSSIGDPPRVAVDSARNIYFGALHSIFKVDPTGSLTRIAGTGRSGNTGDGGPAVNAQLNSPDGIAVDGGGNIYVADRSGGIRRITPDGNINAFSTANCSGLAVDSAGNLYGADSADNLIIRFTPDGQSATIAGNGNADFTGDGGPAVNAALNMPRGVAVDSAGNIYIADTLNNRVREVTPDGNIMTIIGTGKSSYSKDATPALKAGLFLPTDVAVDNSGNLFIADYGNCLIREIVNGVIVTVAGGIQAAPPVIGQAAVSGQFSGATGLAVDAAGVIYFAEGSEGTGSDLSDGDFRIWKVTTDGLLFSAAGDGIRNYSGDNGPATAAQLDTPASLALDSSGNLYVADALNHRIRRVGTDGTITTVAGNGSQGFSGDGGPAAGAQLDTPRGVAVDAAGDLYIADSGNNRIREVTPDGTISTIAGNGNPAFYGDGGPAMAAAFKFPTAITLDSAGNIYVADTLTYRVREITTDGNINTIAGDGTPKGLNLPVAVAVDARGNVYISEQDSGLVREVASGGAISTIATLKAASGLALDSSGNLYIADSGGQMVYQLSGGSATPIAGTGTCCYSGDSGPALNAQLSSPWGLAIDASGHIYVADSGNNAIRMLQLAA